jgi:hypothetical protein
VLALAAQLGLTESQQRKVTEIFDGMSAAAKPLGEELIAHEQALDQLFAKGEITPDGRDGRYRRIARPLAFGASGRASGHSCLAKLRADCPL